MEGKKVLNKAKKFDMITALENRFATMSFLHVFSRNPVLHIIDSRSRTLRE